MDLGLMNKLTIFDLTATRAETYLMFWLSNKKKCIFCNTYFNWD